MVYIIEEHVYLYPDLDVAVGFGSSSSINGLDEILGCESLSLSCVRSIEDVALNFFYIEREEASHDHVLPIVN